MGLLSKGLFGSSLTGMLLIEPGRQILTDFVWLMSSEDPQVLPDRGLWTFDGIWGNSELWYK